MKKLFLSLYLGLFLSAALACTPGAGNGPSGDPNCMGGILNTDPYYNNSRSSQNTAPTKIIRHTTVNVPSKYGALARDKKGVIGGSANESSLIEAKKAAMQRCSNGGKNNNCKIITWVRNGCFAVAEGKSGTRWMLYDVTGEIGQVENKAMRLCESKSSECRITVPETCSIP